MYASLTPKCNTFITGNQKNLDLRVVRDNINYKSRNTHFAMTQNPENPLKTLPNFKTLTQNSADKIEISNLKSKGKRYF